MVEAVVGTVGYLAAFLTSTRWVLVTPCPSQQQPKMSPNIVNMSLGEQSCPPLRTAALEPSALEPWLSTSADYRNHSSSFGFFTMVMLRPTLDQLNQTLWAWKPSLGGCGSSLGDANVQLVWKTTALSP